MVRPDIRSADPKRHVCCDEGLHKSVHCGQRAGGFFDNSSSALTGLLGCGSTLAVMPFSISRRVTALALMSAFIALVATGCGSSSSSSSATASTTSQDAARVKFTQCMRDNGVDIPDNPGQGGGAAGRTSIARSSRLLRRPARSTSRRRSATSATRSGRSSRTRLRSSRRACARTASTSRTRGPVAARRPVAVASSIGATRRSRPRRRPARTSFRSAVRAALVALPAAAAEADHGDPG